MGMWVETITENDEIFRVYEVWDASGAPDYYEVYDEAGSCLNEGEIIPEYPSEEFVKHLAREWMNG